MIPLPTLRNVHLLLRRYVKRYALQRLGCDSDPEISSILIPHALFVLHSYIMPQEMTSYPQLFDPPNFIPNDVLFCSVPQNLTHYFASTTIQHLETKCSTQSGPRLCAILRIYVKCISKTALRLVCILSLFQTPKFHPE